MIFGYSKFCFDVPMEGALRNLRSRSFYLEMASEVLVDQILNELNLTRVHVIMCVATDIYCYQTLTKQKKL